MFIREKKIVDCLVELARKAEKTTSESQSEELERLYEGAFKQYELVLRQNTDDISAHVNCKLDKI